MSLFKVFMHYPNGETEETDEIFSTEREAREYGEYLRSCCSEGAETLHLSNPGDDPEDDCGEVEFEVVER